MSRKKRSLTENDIRYIVVMHKRGLSFPEIGMTMSPTRDRETARRAFIANEGRYRESDGTVEEPKKSVWSRISGALKAIP